jgi:protein TonB
MMRRSFRSRRDAVDSGGRSILLWSIGGAAVVVVLVIVALAQFSQPSNSAQPTWKNLVHTVAHPAQAFKVASATIQHNATPTVLPATPAPAPSQAPTPQATTAPAKVSKTDVAAVVAAKKRTEERKLAAARKKAAAPTIFSTGSNVASASNNAGLAPIVQITPAPRRVARAAISAPTAQPETYVDPQLVRQAGADYPLMARDQGVQGTTVIQVSVSTSGGISSVSVAQSSGNRLLDDAAVRAAYRSKFQPATRNGAPTSSTARLVYTFSL